MVLPSNSPGVHSLWTPAFALKTPLVLKPGSAEPWTPYRIIQALIQAGAPPEVFGYYPADHAGGGEILRQCGRGMVFGDVASTRLWQGDPRIEVHGPGYSKIVIGEDCDRRLGEVPGRDGGVDPGKLRTVVHQCVGRVGAARHAEIAEALAAAAGRVAPRDEADEQAQIAPFADAGVAARISQMIDGELDEGARDVTAAYRRARGWPTSRAAPTCCRPSFCAIRPSIRWPTASSCSRSPAWCR